MLSVANGYLGYLEQDEVVSAGLGEAKRQYYGPELYDALADGAELAVHVLKSPPPGQGEGKGEGRPPSRPKTQSE